MAMTADSVADGIAALTVAGVNIRSLGAVPQSFTDRDFPVVYPGA
jgi:hypothetical protein